MDPELVIRAQQGDDAAFAALARGLYGRFLQVAFRVLRDRQLAEDMTQQALVQVWRTLPRLRDPARFEAWPYRLLTNACISEIRRRPAQRMLSLVTDIAVPGDEMARIHDRDQLARAFTRLSAEQRVVVVLHHYVGMTTIEVADVLGIAQGTVASRLARAMARLRQVIDLDQPALRVADAEEA